MSAVRRSIDPRPQTWGSETALPRVTSAHAGGECRVCHEHIEPRTPAWHRNWDCSLACTDCGPYTAAERLTIGLGVVLTTCGACGCALLLRPNAHDARSRWRRCSLCRFAARAAGGVK